MSAAEDMNAQMVFQPDPLRFHSGPPNRVAGPTDPPPKTSSRELTGFIDDKLFSSTSTSAVPPNDRFFPSGTDFPRNMYRRDWNVNGNGSSADESDGVDDDDDMDDDMDDDDDVEGDNSNNNKTSTTIAMATNAGDSNNNSVNKINENEKPKQLSSFGEVMVKDGGGSLGQSGNNGNSNSNNLVTIAEPDGEIYHSQYLQANEGSGSGKDTGGGVENGVCGFSGRKDGSSSISSESGDSLKVIFSDPITGALMDDAMILPCGHSFGAGGVQHIIRTKACYTCSQPVIEESIAPNLSLRAAVQAFRREDELQFYRASRRKRERLDQDKGGFGNSASMDAPRGRGVQFPFAVTDRVIIKGNKRTPQRFVGREAVVTTQCLNGWYVVKTLDNAESVKLQYRSLAKVSDDPSAKEMPSRMPPNWL